MAQYSSVPIAPLVLCLCCVQWPVHQRPPAAIVDFFIGFSLRYNTRKTYGAHHRAYFALCSDSASGVCQLTEDNLCLIVAVDSSRGHKITTIPGFIAAIANHALTQRHGPLPRGTRFDQLMAGLRNYYGNENVSVPKTALTMSDLVAFHPHVDRSTFEGARDWCAYMLAFFGLPRVGEYTDGRLRMQDVRLTPWGVSLIIPFSKTSLIPTQVDIVSRTDVLCPARALSDYLSFFTLYPGLPHQPADPLFISRLPSGFTPLSSGDFINRMRAILLVAFPGRDPNSYAGHSFRRGGTTALRLAGVSDSIIQQHGRWKSDAYRAYIDSDHNLQTRLMATAALNVPASQ
jgi:hypothetical protein